MNKALLLIDIQNDYFPGGAWELSHVDEAAAQARLALEQAQLSYDQISGGLRPAASRAGVVQKVHVKEGEVWLKL